MKSAGRYRPYRSRDKGMSMQNIKLKTLILALENSFNLGAEGSRFYPSILKVSITAKRLEKNEENIFESNLCLRYPSWQIFRNLWNKGILVTFVFRPSNYSQKSQNQGFLNLARLYIDKQRITFKSQVH